jgi:hypothetical protein
MSLRPTIPLAAIVLAVVAVAAGCGGAAGPSASTAVATSPTAVTPTAAPTGSGSADVPAIVGTWVGTLTCERIVAQLQDAGMESQILPNIVDAALLPGVTDVAQVADPSNPCVGAVPKEHSHFFTAGGEFGSLDFNGNQVDDGPWSLEGPGTVSISGVPFGFEIVGDELHLTPVDVGTCPADSTEWCEEAWKVMVAMPGLAWTRR